MYVLEDREVIDINKAFLGNDPELEPKIRYLGKITNKAQNELAPREEVLRKFALPDKKIILMSLGRSRRVADLSIKLFSIFEEAGVSADHQIVYAVDTYLDRELANQLRNTPSSKHVRFFNFVPNLVDLVNQSEMVISRAGYNTVNEILLTGIKAILIPESHGSAEQEQRVRSVPNENILVLSEDQVLQNGRDTAMLDLLNSDQARKPVTFDKYRAGKYIIDELEDWVTQKKSSPAEKIDRSKSFSS